jgi:IS5 family transposase
MSDEVLIQNAEVNMAYKYFLDLDPEDKLVDASLLTKFRKTRITEDILEEMLRETIRQAIEKGLIRSTAILVDPTHVNSHVRASKPAQILRKLTKQLRREIYQNMYETSSKFPDKPAEEAELTEEISYARRLLESIERDVQASGQGKARQGKARHRNYTHRLRDCWTANGSGKYVRSWMKTRGLDTKVQPIPSLDIRFISP